MPRKRDLVSLQPMPFEEAVSDILKIKPPPEKRRRRNKRERGQARPLEKEKHDG
jgi:hypothetical protein